MARKLAYLFAAFAITLCSSAFALGLGGIESRSALNQPLSARIPLHAIQPEELEQVSVRLASSEAFARAGVDRPFHLSRLRFEVVDDGGPYIRIITREPVQEPFLDFLLEVSWPHGRMVREYTLLLDPPVFADEERAAPARAPATRAASAPRQSSPAAAGARAAAAAPTAAVPAAETLPGEYVVADGDTLWGVAGKLRPDTAVGQYQTLLGLVRANPHAFIDGDPNRLKRGAILRVPEREELRSLSNSAAAREYQRLLAATRRTTPVAEPATVATAAPEAKPEAAPEAPAADGGRLQVVASRQPAAEDDAGSLLDVELEPSAANVERLQRELGLLHESQLSLESENEDLRNQVASMKEAIVALERMVNLQVQQGAPAAETAPPAASEPAVTPVAERTPAAAAPVASAPPLPVEEPTAFSLLQDTQTLSMLLGAALVLALLGLLVVRRRRLAAAAPVTLEFEQPAAAEASSAGAPESAAADAAGELPAGGDDPLAEAEVYLAYGRYEQAEQLVTAALEAAPEDAELRLKLLEILALTHNRPAFEAQAEQLHAQVAGAGPLWQRAVDMGREIAPEHPFFSDTDGTLEEVAVEAAEPEFAADEPALAEPEVADVAPAAVEAPADGALEFELDIADDAVPEWPTEGEEVVAEALPDAGADFDFDFEFADSAAAEPEREPDAAAEAVDEGLSFAVDEEPVAAPEPAASDADFAFDFELADAPAAEGAAEQPAELEETPEPELEQASELEGDESLDEVSTKLDLARAYLDMGDQEGARGLLSEVVEEGDAGQRAAAERLLQQLG